MVPHELQVCDVNRGSTSRTTEPASSALLRTVSRNDPPRPPAPRRHALQALDPPVGSVPGVGARQMLTVSECREAGDAEVEADLVTGVLRRRDGRDLQRDRDVPPTARAGDDGGPGDGVIRDGAVPADHQLTDTDEPQAVAPDLRRRLCCRARG